MHEVMNGLLYVLETDCQWRALLKDLPPKSTVHDYLMLWDWGGPLERVHHALDLMTRDLEGREASPSAAVINSQSVKGAKKGARTSTRRAMTRARKLKAVGVISSSIPSVSSLLSRSTWPTCRIATAPFLSKDRGKYSSQT